MSNIEGKFSYRTITEVCASVAKLWYYQYTRNGNQVMPPDREDTYWELHKNTDMRPQTINEIIGNNSWTQNRCDLCKQNVEKLVLFDGMAFNEYGSSALCKSCVEKLLEGFNE